MAKNQPIERAQTGWMVKVITPQINDAAPVERGLFPATNQSEKLSRKLAIIPKCAEVMWSCAGQVV